MISNSLPSLALCYCYTDEDAALLDELDKHLAQGARWVSSWSDRAIAEGGDWRASVDEAVVTADLLLLLVTEHFIAADYCSSAELQQALKRHAAGEAMVVPIILQAAAWQETPLGALSALPRADQPLLPAQDAEAAFAQLASEIRALAQELQLRIANSPTVVVDRSSMRALPLPDENAVDENAVDENAVDENAVDENAVDENAVDENAVDENAVDENVADENAVDENVADENIADENAADENAVPAGSGAEDPRGPRNPYKGLRSFTLEDAGDFFGRAAYIDEIALLIENILTREKKGGASSRLLAVVGPAGAGKSSFVRAGLVPCLRAGGVFDSGDWIYLDLVVLGEHPIMSLARVLQAQLPRLDLGQIHEALQEAGGLHFYATEIIKRAGEERTRVLLVIDQFEELLTLASDKEERRRFVNLLVNACTREEGPLIVVLTLRSDFSGRLAQYPGLFALTQMHRATPSALAPDDLRAAITQPALLPDVQIRFEDGLVDALLRAARGKSTILPPLQFTLDELFRRRTGDLLTLQAYRELGTVEQAIAQCAEQTYQTLPSELHRVSAYALFLHLVDPGTIEQSEPTLRRVPLTDLKLADPEQTQRVQESLDAFVNARLLTMHKDDDGPTVTVSHEAVLASWPRLVEWLRVAREDNDFKQTFDQDVAEWDGKKRPAKLLYRGGKLNAARSWATRNGLNKPASTFLQASAVRRRRFLALLSIVVVLLLLSLGAGGEYYISRLPSPLLVTTMSNSGIGSLRWCIDTAPSGSTITFGQRVRGTITFSGGDLSIAEGKELSIKGPGASQLTLRSGDRVSAIVVSPDSVLTLSGLSVRGSKLTGRSILSNSGTLTLNDSVVAGNSSGGDGGGISSSDGILTLNNSTLSGNTAGGNGGGIFFFNGTLTLNNSIISGNASSTGNGGGLYISSSIINMNNSTVSTNAAIAGGGIYAYNNTLTVTNDTISSNTATSNGGGISSYNSTLTVRSSTLYGNTTGSNGGGLSINSADTPAAIRNYPVVLQESIVAGNHAEQGLDVSGTLLTRGYNLLQAFAGANFIDAQKLHATDKEVSNLNSLFIDATLGKNGGPTPTHALLAGSPAIDAVPLNVCGTKTTDQRGVKRPQGNACDIGAYEYQAHP